MKIVQKARLRRERKLRLLLWDSSSHLYATTLLLADSASCTHAWESDWEYLALTVWREVDARISRVGDIERLLRKRIWLVRGCWSVGWLSLRRNTRLVREWGDVSSFAYLVPGFQHGKAWLRCFQCLLLTLYTKVCIVYCRLGKFL